MRIHSPFVKLPLTFDSRRLAEEIGQFGEDEWRIHPQRFEGNSSLVLVSTRGEENDDFSRPMQPSPRLLKSPYIRQVIASFDTVIGRSRLMRLAPGASVTGHIDSHYFWRDHVRIHIPVVTDPTVTFHCDTEEVHMAAGESWTFNNWLMHSVENRSDRERIHLVIDTVGSANLWRMIDGRDTTLRHIDFEPSSDPVLRFEEYIGLPVMPPVELTSDLQRLVTDMAENSSNEPSMIDLVKARSADFMHDWHCLWVSQGPSVDSFPAFQALLESFRKQVFDLPDHLQLASNGESFNKAVLYTLGAALDPDNFSARDYPVSGGSLPSTQRPRFDRPVFIVAAPRSGSTLLFETLAVNRELWSVGDETHKHFESILSLRPNQENPSNRLTADMATRDVVDTLLNSLVADLRNSDGRMMSQFPPVTRPNELRFLEKTPKNALRIPFILRIFPDARFIFLFRDARQNISSLLDSWRSRSYVTYPRLPGWPADNPWSHLLIPGWQELIGHSLAEIVAQQWLVTNETILQDLQDVPSERWCAIEYDSLVADTHNELQRLCAFAQIIFGPRMHEIASKPLKASKYTLTTPRPDKWKKNAAEIEPVISSTEVLMAKLRGLV